MIDLLENIIVPGGRARISPYVQDAQLQVLFGKTPEPHNRHDGIRSILAEHDHDLQNLSETYIKFANAGRQFIPTTYQQTEFLKLYLAYYLTTNVSKIQLCLLDLVRSDKISSNLKIIDIGVGAGTTAIATLDFLLAWVTASHLAGKTFPVKSITIESYDISPVCLKMAEKAVNAFCDAVSRRKKDISCHEVLSDGMNLVISSGQSARWVNANVSQIDLQCPEDVQVLLFASNVLTELSNSDKVALESRISGLPSGSIATIIVSGDRNQCGILNTWKAELLLKQKGISSLFPCGEGIVNQNTPCKSCWNSRRESLHEPLLYRSLRDKAGDSRSFNEYSNNLLSWSYSCLELKERIEISECPDIDESGIITRILGKFWRKKEKDEPLQFIDGDPDGIIEVGGLEFIKLCPLTGDRKTDMRDFWARRLPGHLLPSLSHGSKVKILNGQARETTKDGLWIIPFDQTVEVKPYDDKPKRDEFLVEYTDLTKGAIDEISFRLFGFPSMRPFQHEILSRVLTGHHILGIAATGGGKSECFILPAMLFSGVTIVVSPLKSLMQDQYEKRIDERYGLGNLATCINGEVPFKERQVRLKRLELGYYKIAYFTPEQLRQSHVLNAIKRANDKVGIRYLALDEAHCISQWGHDFRDSYLNLVSRLLERGVDPVRIALTATASPEVRVDLCDELGLNNAPLASGGDVYIHSSNRVELNLIVKTTSNTEEKSDDMVDRLQSLLSANRHTSNPGAAIVFMPLTGNDSIGSTEDENSDAGRCSARVSDFASYLERKLRKRVAIYHGKMDFDHEEDIVEPLGDRDLGDLSGRCRKFEQTAFIDGQHPIMVATKGFGMGIDKPNIRLIIHRSPTANLEAYAQEAGRAGRDGQISDVVLYYSPDSTEESGAIRSDHKIQDFFLSQKYIHREDVVAMRKFLSTADRKINGNLYFTSDEVIPFFDHLDIYTWPDFPPRLRKGKESREHSVILDRGYEYSEKVRYIDRILSVLYRIRPSIGSSKRVCLISSYQESGAVIIPRLGSPPLNPDAIVGSNEYFGEFLRSKNVGSDSLKEWISKCTSNDTVPFARFLGLSISETASMLWDINRADGKFKGGKWESTLLNFSFIAPPKYGALLENTTLSDVRRYKGAAKRASYLEARKRASYAVQKGQERDENNNNEIMPSMDDWFGWWELPSSKGWEILPGSALLDSLVFDSYLEAFMNLHDRRRDNDRDAYNLLLTDYVGVNSDGTLRHVGDAKKCLRDVLLGYLKTGEVVQGGDCRSCSSCAPNGNFETDLKERSKLVVSLGTEILAFLESLERCKDNIPIDGQIGQLWEIVRSEETQGRSLNTYIEGWTGRLLTESQGQHLTANWIRVDGMVRGILPLQTQEICPRLLALLDRLEDDTYIPALWDTIDLIKDVVPEVPESLVIRAKASQRLNRIQEAQSLWLELLNRTIAKPLRHLAHSALFSIYKSGVPSFDRSSFTHHGYEAARSAPDFKLAVRFYAETLENWQWEDLCTELVWCVTNNSDFRQPLLDWWLNQHLKLVVQQASSLSTGGLSIITNLAGNIAGETSKREGIEELLSKDIIRWCEKLLSETSNAFHIRALKIILLARYGESIQGLDADLSAYLDTADSMSLQDLLSFNESENVFTIPYVPELLQAELAYRNGEYPTAESHWGNSMDTLPQSLLDMVGDRILLICQKSSKSTNYSIPQRFHNLMLDRLNNINDWGVAVSIFKDIAPDLDVAELLQLLVKFGEHGPLKMLELIDIWAGCHSQIRGTHKIIEIACISFNKVISGISVDKFNSIINKFHPYEVVSFDKFDSLKVPNFLNRYLEHCSAECLLFAYKSGIIDKSTVEKYNLGVRLLDINAVTQLNGAETDNTVDSDMAEMKQHYLLNEYQPKSIDQLYKWLCWLDTYKLLSPELLSKLPDSFEHFLTHASTRSDYDQSLALFMEYAPDHLTEIFHLIKATVDIITDIEGKTSIYLAESLDKDNLALLAKTMVDIKEAKKADVYISILRSIRARTKPGWKTPLVRLVEFLVNSGRVGEAELFGNEPNLTYGKKQLPFREFVQQFNGELRSPPSNDAIINRVTDAYVRTWLFCAASVSTQLKSSLQSEYHGNSQKYEIEPRSSQYGPVIIRRKKTSD